MWPVLRRNPLAVILAVILHLVILGFLIVRLDWWQEPVAPKPKANVVQAEVVDAGKLEAEVRQRKAEEAAAVRREQERLQELQRKQEQEKKRLADLERQRKEQEAEAQRVAEKKRQEQAALERKRKEEAKRKEVAKAKAAEERKQAEAAKAKAEAERKQAEAAKAKAEEERKRAEAAKAKAEQEARRKEEAARRAAEERGRREALAAEQNAREIERYVAAIKRQIERTWLRPQNAARNLRCTLKVRLIPGGDVIPGSAVVIQSSGNSAFDRSVESAVYKAAPLPVPSGSLFESFRELQLVFDPSK